MCMNDHLLLITTDILNNVSTALAHAMKVNGVQNNIEPHWLSLYGQKTTKNILQLLVKLLDAFYIFVSNKKNTNDLT